MAAAETGVRGSHHFPVFQGVGKCGWNRETDAFSFLLAKDALNMRSFPQRGLLYVVSLDPRPHRLKPIGNSSADSSASAGGCYVWLCRRSSAEWLGTYADARRWRVGRAACPCSPVEVSFQVTVALLSALPLFTCLWCGWRGNRRVSVCGSSGCGDASGLRKLRDCCGATQGGLCCAREGCWRVVGSQGCVSMGMLLLGLGWRSWMALSSGWTCCLVQPCAGCQAESSQASQQLPSPQSLTCGLYMWSPRPGCLASLLGKLGKTPPVGGERLKL